MNYSIKRIKAHLETAYIYSKLSYATKKKVGAVLVSEDRIISVGYNGTPTGLDNTCEYYDEDGKLQTYDSVLHAEENVIVFAAKHGVATNNCMMVITHSPCMRCARLIVQAGITDVIYGELTRHNDAINYLESAGINVNDIKLIENTL